MFNPFAAVIKGKNLPRRFFLEGYAWNGVNKRLSEAWGQLLLTGTYTAINRRARS